MDPTSAPHPRLQTSQLAAGATTGPGHGQLLQVGLKCWAILGWFPLLTMIPDIWTINNHHPSTIIHHHVFSCFFHLWWWMMVDGWRFWKHGKWGESPPRDRSRVKCSVINFYDQQNGDAWIHRHGYKHINNDDTWASDQLKIKNRDLTDGRCWDFNIPKLA